MKIIKIAILAFLVSSFLTLGIDLEVKSLMNNKVELKIPKDFEIMSKEMLQLKYARGNAPTLVYTDKTGGINVAMNYTQSKANQANIGEFKDYLVKTFKGGFPDAEWKDTGFKVINGKKVGYIEVITPAIDTKIYNLLFFTDMGGRLLLCTFNCTHKSINDWQPAAKEIMESLKIK